MTIVVFVMAFVQPVAAKSLSIGLTIDMSGANAQYALDFKNGVEAFITAENAKKRFGNYKLKLVVMDDFGKPERVYTNTKRLLKHKHVLALLSNHELKHVPKLLNLATSHKTLLLTSNSNDIRLNRKQLNVIGQLTAPPNKLLEPAHQLIKEANKIYLVSDQPTTTKKWFESLVQLTNRPVYLVSRDKIKTQSPTENILYVIDQNFANAANFIPEYLATSELAKILILPRTGASLLANALNHNLDSSQLSNLFYLNTVPLHDSSSPMLKRFSEDMEKFNPHATQSHQALKGYLLAYFASESIYHSVKGIKTDSVLDVVTLPFQVLDQVVGWVKHAGSDISSGEVVDTFSRMKNFNAGLYKLISIDKNRIILGDSWLTKSNKMGQFKVVSSNKGGRT